jgi:hypothetical protein
MIKKYKGRAERVSQYDAAFVLIVTPDNRRVGGCHKTPELSVLVGIVHGGVVVIVVSVLAFVLRWVVGVGDGGLALRGVLPGPLRALKKHVLKGSVHQILPRVGAPLFQV